MKTNLLAIFQAPIFILSLLLHTIWVIRKENVDVVNSHWLLPNGLIGAFITSVLGIPHVLTLHARGVLVLQKVPFGWLIVNYVYQRSDMILPVSTHIRDCFLEIGGGTVPVDGQFQIQPMGAHVNEYDVSSKSELRVDTGVDGEIQGLFVGRLAEKKGVDYLLDAMTIVSPEVDNFHLSIVGRGPLQEELHNYADKLDLNGYVTFKGWVSEKELIEQYIMADFVVVPSIEAESGDTEGMPTVIAEAFASGNPVIGTEVGGIPDVVKQGENGYVVPQKDAGAIAKRMRQLISEPELRQDLEEGALDSAERLDWERCAETYKEVFRSVSIPESIKDGGSV